MDAWEQWREMAREAEKAARLAETDGCLRSAASRYYYAAYQAVTALLLYRGLIPPIDREAWNHTDTPLLVKDNLGALIRSRNKRNDIARRVFNLYELRLTADYAGSEPIYSVRVSEAGRDARYLLSVADDVLPKKEQRP